ncbi:caspase family protein [Streptomyces sp. V4I8]|uniref:HD domain-containing protein n=1 Tax=Streptomyces sp. V4I8 TaxID=3156469 RepID=UPI003518637C
MEEARRTALLVGVGDNPGAEHRLPSLRATVDADLRAMKAALHGSGYTVHTLRDPQRNEITERVTTLSRAARADSTLLLYFTGHGVRIGDTDYLVPADGLAPADGDPDWDRPHIRESLLDADISRYVTDCGAGTVLWLIDACRSAEDGGEAAFGSHVTRGPRHGGFAMMTGCAPGERSGFAESGSFFSLALAHAFDPLTEATTVEQVYQWARQRTRELARRARTEPQQVLIRYGSDLEAETRGREVARGRRLLEAWLDVVRTPVLWDHVRDGDAEVVARLQDCLTSLAEDAARLVHHAQQRLPDPWADDEFPVRLLTDRLPLLLPKDAELSALEVTALIAGVLLHEAAWADRLSQAAELHPQHVRRDPGADDQRRHYEQIAEHHPQVAEKLAHWHWWESDPSDDRNAVTLWLVHNWIAERFATDEEAVPPGPANGFVARLLGAAPAEPTGRAAQLSTALRAVAAGIVLGAPPDGQRPPLPARHVVRKTPQRLRVRPLAALLRLAGLLAFDTRRLPEVLAEHLVVSDPVVPRDVITVLRDAVWDLDRLDQDGGAPSYLHLDAVCRHPALHAALTELVEGADELGYALRETAQRLPDDEGGLLRNLPARLTDHRLRPDEERGLAAYDVPPARFSLAQTEIRRLLMGKRLYDGKPSLALRELYQNAMDACRYREMRVRYLRGCGKGAPGLGGRHPYRDGRGQPGPVRRVRGQRRRHERRPAEGHLHPGRAAFRPVPLLPPRAGRLAASRPVVAAVPQQPVRDRRVQLFHAGRRHDHRDPPGGHGRTPGREGAAGGDPSERKSVPGAGGGRVGWGGAAGGRDAGPAVSARPVHAHRGFVSRDTAGPGPGQRVRPAGAGRGRPGTELAAGAPPGRRQRDRGRRGLGRRGGSRHPVVGRRRRRHRVRRHRHRPDPLRLRPQSDRYARRRTQREPQQTGELRHQVGP